jgi:hypothetical protein
MDSDRNLFMNKITELLRAADFNVINTYEATLDVDMESYLSIRVSPENLAIECRRLLKWAESKNICVEEIGTTSIWIEGRYDPTNDLAVIVFIGISDKCLD